MLKYTRVGLLVIMLVVSMAGFGSTFAQSNDSGTTQIVLNGDSISVDGSGAVVNNNTVTINAGGSYAISGNLNDGQIMVDTDSAVTLTLNGVNVKNSSSAPLYVANAEQTTIVLADGSQNYLEDSANYVLASAEEDEPNAALFSKDDLVFSGNGTLTVIGNYNDGIVSKDVLTILGGTFNVTAVDDGIRGKDLLQIENGTFVVNAGGDALKSDEEDDPTLGVINIVAGNFTINAGGDAITAFTTVQINSGEFDLTAGGGSNNVISADLSAKGIKAGTSVVIETGNFVIDTADDGIHSNNAVTINNGTFVIASGDDGIHGDATVDINNGDINILQSYEGIESAVITINAGTIHVVASDDGINVAGGNDGSGFGGGPGRGGAPGQETFGGTSDYMLYINGGYIYVDAQCDGLDANGIIQMTGGIVLVNGPTMNGNGALDYDGGFTLSGGILVAAGSAGMAQAPGQTSTQNSILVGFDNTLAAGTLVHIQDSAGNELLTFAPSKEFQTIVFSSPELVTGGTYEVYTGGSSDGTVTDGYYQGGTYSGGTLAASLTIASVVTQSGVTGGMGGPGGMGGGDRGGRPN